jgi:hypothetical protein
MYILFTTTTTAAYCLRYRHSVHRRRRIILSRLIPQLPNVVLYQDTVHLFFISPNTLRVLFYCFPSPAFNPHNPKHSYLTVSTRHHERRHFYIREVSPLKVDIPYPWQHCGTSVRRTTRLVRETNARAARRSHHHKRRHRLAQTKL